MGMRCLKVGQIPSKADPERQAEYKKKLEPRLEEARSLKRAVFFVDAAHARYGRIFRNGLVFSCESLLNLLLVEKDLMSWEH